MKARDDESLPLLKGTLDLLVLQAVGLRHDHGYAITVWLENSGEQIVLEDSAVYQALHRLRGRGYLAAEWTRTDNNRRARRYTLTAAGRRHLERSAATWRRYAEWVGRVLAIGPGDG